MRELIIDEGIRKSIAKVQVEHDFRLETGGILIGLYDPERGALKITDMSYAYPSDHCGRFHFSRKSMGHQELADDLWVKSGYTKAYLGEWHTHNQPSPIPSITDRNTWKRISKQKNNYDQCYFLIIGRVEYIIWTVINGVIIEIERQVRSIEKV